MKGYMNEKKGIAMKKYISLLYVLFLSVVTVSFVSCGDDDEIENPYDTSNQVENK